MRATFSIETSQPDGGKTRLALEISISMALIGAILSFFGLN
jgi:hypothetical protein